MNRILILDSDTSLRSELLESIAQAGHQEVVLVADEEELAAKVQYGLCAAVFADGELLQSGRSGLIAAMRSAIVRPMLIVASNEKSDDLDPDLVTLVVRKPYDVQTLTGILLSAVLPLPADRDGTADSPPAG